MRALVFLLMLFPSVATAAINSTRIEIVNAPSPLWEERIHSELDRANRFLCQAFSELPQAVRVYRSDRGPEYDLSLGLIFIDQDYLPVHLYHEYGHKVLDHYLHGHSSVLNYYRMRDRIGRDQSLQQSMSGLERQLAEDQRFLKQLRQRHYFKLAGNLSRWIRNHTDLLYEASAVVHLERYLTGAFEQLGQDRQRRVFKLMAPYHELFADTLAVLMTGRWESVMMASRSTPSASLHRLGFSNYTDRIPFADILHYRTFQPRLSLQNYRFSSLEADSDYTQFAPVRSYIRELSERHFRGREAMLLLTLAEAIQQQLELRLSDVAQLDLNLKSMNQGLIDSLQQRMRFQDAGGSDHCQPSSAIAGVR